MAKHSELHIRRCHVCGATNEAQDKLVDHCSECGKSLAPFYFFDERSLMGYGDVVHTDYILKKDRQTNLGNPEVARESSYRPLLGLTSFW